MIRPLGAHKNCFFFVWWGCVCVYERVCARKIKVRKIELRRSCWFFLLVYSLYYAFFVVNWWRWKGKFRNGDASCNSISNSKAYFTNMRDSIRNMFFLLLLKWRCTFIYKFKYIFVWFFFIFSLLSCFHQIRFSLIFLYSFCLKVKITWTHIWIFSFFIVVAFCLHVVVFDSSSVEIVKTKNYMYVCVK